MKKQIIKQIPEVLFDIVDDYKKDFNIVLAGGAINSIYSNRAVNDLDIYVVRKSNTELKYDIINELSKTIEKSCTKLSDTKRSKFYIYSEGGDKYYINLVSFKIFDSIEEIFNTFDFTIVRGAYDITNDKLVLDNDFVLHIAQRKLIITNELAYPISTYFRVKKYIDYGYNIKDYEMLKILLEFTKIDLSDYEKFTSQLVGFYGMKTIFTLENIIDVLTHINIDDDYKIKIILNYIKQTQNYKSSMMKILLDSSNNITTYLNINDSILLIDNDNVIVYIVTQYINEDNKTLLNLLLNKFDASNELYAFKNVKNVDDGTRFTSHHNKSYVYKMNEFYANDGTFYIFDKFNVQKHLMNGYKSNIIIKCVLKDIVDIRGTEIIVNNFKPISVVDITALPLNKSQPDDTENDVELDLFNIT